MNNFSRSVSPRNSFRRRSLSDAGTALEGTSCLRRRQGDIGVSRDQVKFTVGVVSPFQMSQAEHLLQLRRRRRQSTCRYRIGQFVLKLRNRDAM